MEITFAPTCVHCGNTIEYPEKSYCNRCGNAWDAPSEAPSSQLPNWMVQENDLLPSTRLMSSLHLLPDPSTIQEELGREFQNTSSEVDEPTDLDTISTPDTYIEADAPTNLDTSRNVGPYIKVDVAPTGVIKEDRLDQRQEDFSPTGTIEPSSARTFSSDEILERLRQLQEQIPQSLLMLRETSTQLAPLTLDEILERLHMLRAKIQRGETQQYFPGNRQDNAEMLLAWRSHVEQAYKTIEFLEGLSIEPEYTDVLHSSLTEMSRHLDFTLPYQVMLVGPAGTNIGMLLGTLLGENIFVDLLRLSVNAIRVAVHFCDENEQEKLTVSFSDNERPAEVFARSEWETIWSELENSPQGAGEVKHIEINVQTRTHPLLPVGSTFIAVLSNGVNEIDAQVLLDEDLSQSDAILLVVNTPYFPIGAVRHLAKHIITKISANKSPRQISEMLFVVAGHDEKVTSLETMHTLGKGLHLLHSVLPQNYSKQHHHGPGKSFFFYPIQIEQAFFAMMGLQKEPMNADLQEGASRYYESARANYEQLKYLEPGTPSPFNTQGFDEMTQEQHKGMLFLSSISELTHDLQQFLRAHRSHTQLALVESARMKSLELVEELCWEKLEGYGIHVSNRSLDTTGRALQAFERKRLATHRVQITKRMHIMQNAWKEALRDFEIQTRMDEKAETTFHRELEAAHRRAGEYVLRRIQKGYFDRYFETGMHRSGIISSLTIDRLGVEVHLWELLGKLRISLQTAIEKELQKPAYALAQAFLTPLELREKAGGPLNIPELSFDESKASLDDILKQYHAIKHDIYEKAHQACQWITFSELLSDERRLSFKTPAVSQFIAFVQAYEGPENDFYQQAHEHLQTLLLEIQKGIAERTERAIIDSLRYELDKLDTYEVYDRDEQEEVSTQPGAFTLLIQELEDRLVERLRFSEEFGQKLDAILYPDAKNTTFWWSLLRDVQEIKGGSPSLLETSGISS